MHAKDLKTRGCAAFKQNVTVRVRQIVAPCLLEAPGKVHLALFIKVKELEGCNNRGLAYIIRAHKVQRGVYLNLCVIIPAGMEQDEPYRSVQYIQDSCSPVPPGGISSEDLSSADVSSGTITSPASSSSSTA